MDNTRYAQCRTLAEWSAEWPYRVTQHPAGAYVTPDIGDNTALRIEAFWLRDYLVSSVTGGSIWFVPRR